MGSFFVNSFNIIPSFKDLYFFLVYPFYQKTFEKNLSIDDYYRYNQVNYCTNILMSLNIFDTLILIYKLSKFHVLKVKNNYYLINYRLSGSS